MALGTKWHCKRRVAPRQAVGVHLLTCKERYETAIRIGHRVQLNPISELKFSVWLEYSSKVPRLSSRTRHRLNLASESMPRGRPMVEQKA